MNLISIPILIDNYVWFLYNNSGQCLIIDPGEAESILQTISKRQLFPIAILLTHHHHDHVGGVKEILKYYPQPVYGSEETRMKGATHIVHDGSKLLLLDRIFNVISLPGHTLGHIGFYSKPWFFCGDTMFSAGCGRLFEGTPKQMYMSLQKINCLPPETLICAGHEYTLINLEFASTILPQDSIIANYKRKIKKLRINGQFITPTTLHFERQINIFLRCRDINLQNDLNKFANIDEEWHIFAKLRERKDFFKNS